MLVPHAASTFKQYSAGGPLARKNLPVGRETSQPTKINRYAQAAHIGTYGRPNRGVERPSDRAPSWLWATCVGRFRPSPESW